MYKGRFFGFVLFYVGYICRSPDFSVSEDAGIEPRTDAMLALTAWGSNHSARSHPQYINIQYICSHNFARNRLTGGFISRPIYKDNPALLPSTTSFPPPAPPRPAPHPSPPLPAPPPSLPNLTANYYERLCQFSLSFFLSFSLIQPHSLYISASPNCCFIYYWVRPRGSQRDVVYLGWPIAPSYMSPNVGGRGVAGFQPISTAVHMEPK